MMRGQTQGFCNNLLLFECARAQTWPVTATGQDICYKSANSLGAAIRAKVCLLRAAHAWNYLGTSPIFALV